MYIKTQIKKISLTTDPDLIKNCVQAIDAEFLEWFCSKNGKVGYIESKQETLEGYEEALNHFPEYNQYLERIAFEKGVEWQAERSYNEDEVKTIINDIVEKHCTYFRQETKDSVKLEWFKKFKK